MSKETNGGSGASLRGINGMTVDGVNFGEKHLIRDYNFTPIPQYYDVTEGIFKPLTNNSSGGGGGGADPITDEKIKELQDTMRKGYKIGLNKTLPKSIKLSEDLALEFKYIEFTQSTTSDPPETRQQDGYVFSLVNINTSKSFDINISIDTSGASSSYYTGGYYEWRYGTLAPNEGYELMKNHPGLFNNESESRMMFTNDTSSVTYDVSMVGYIDDSDNFQVTVTVDRTKLITV